VRKGGILTVIIFILLAFAIAYFFTNAWLEQKIESAASGIVGAKVEIDGFHLQLLKLKAGWGRLQVTDPNDTWSNIVETRRAEFDIAVEPLFYKRLIIEALRLEHFQTGTRRTTDGKIPPQKKKQPSNEPTFTDEAITSLTRQLSQSAGFDLSQLSGNVDMDKLIGMLDLETPKNVEALQNDIQTTSDRWKAEVASLDTLKAETEQIVEKVKAIEFDQLKTVPAISDAVETIQSAKKQVETIQESVHSKKSLLIEDGKRLNVEIRLIDDWIREDIQRAADKAKLPDFNAKNIALMLLGPTLGSHIQTAQHYFKMAQYYKGKLPPKEPKVPAPPRFKGQDIPFPDHRHWPKFWLKKMVISAENGNFFAGSLDDFTTDQKITGRPTVIKLGTKKASGIAYTLFGSINRVGAVAADHFQWTASDIPLNGVALVKSNLLPQDVEEGRLNLNMDLMIRDGVLDGNLGIIANALSFRFDEPKKDDLLGNITRDLLRSIEKVTIDFKFSGKPNTLNIDLSSNLDELFSARLRGVVSEQIAKAREKIERRIKDELEPKKQEVLRRYAEKKEKLDQEVAQIENKINEKKELLESKKKELEGRIEGEKKKLEDKVEAEKQKQEEKLKEKGKEKLKNLLR